MQYPTDPAGQYPWGKGLNAAFYYAADRLELEPVSPYHDLAPGRTAEWTVTWRLSPYGVVPAEPGKIVAKALPARK